MSLPPPPPTRPTWVHGDARLARTVGRPLAKFLRVETAGGLVLLGATIIALVWANSPWAASYTALWNTNLSLTIGNYQLSNDIGHWINDGLMTLFFFVVGMEIKQELVVGELSDRRNASLPVLAAAGGMVVPALIYVALNWGGPGIGGWGIPMATDIAFALGVLALLGDRIPSSLKVLLLSLAIVDDIGAITVIAIFYTDQINGVWLTGAVLGLVLVVILRRARVWYLPVYVVLGTAIWWATVESGIHATIAGVILGLLAPAQPLLPAPEAEQIAQRLSTDTAVTTEDLSQVRFELRESVSVTERLSGALHPWSSYLILPLFALANAGIPLTGPALKDAVGSPITAGVVLGLLVGKVVGVGGASWLAVRWGLARLPNGVNWRHIFGVSILAGIGFTVALFITDLAFSDPTDQSNSKIGVLFASAVAAAGAAAVLHRSRAPDSE